MNALYLDKHEDTNKRIISLEIPKKIKTIGQRSYYFMAIKIFNAMPNKLKLNSKSSQMNSNKHSLSWLHKVKKWLSNGVNI